MQYLPWTPVGCQLCEKITGGRFSGRLFVWLSKEIDASEIFIKRGAEGEKLRRSQSASTVIIVSKPISRVLSFKTVIYLGVLLPTRSSHLLGEAGSALALDATPSTVLLQIEFTGPNSSQSAGELLPRLSTLTTACVAVYFCCTFPKVAFGGRYPLSLPYGARTFLTNGLSACLRDCPAYSQ
jgi:hypothetical protein